MTGIGAIGFVAPWILAGLVALPVLYWLLRAIPPSPRTEVFAPVRLLFGLEDPEREAQRTPWWLLALRILAVAAVIVGFSQPVLNPSERLVAGGDGPVLVLIDDGWASAPGWAERRAAASAAIEEAGNAGRPVMLWLTASDGGRLPELRPAAVARAAVDALEPVPVPPDHPGVLGAVESGDLPPPGETIWLTDGLSHGEETGVLASRLAELGPLRLIVPERPARGLEPPRLDAGRLAVDVLRADRAEAPARVVAMAAAEGGGERRVAVAETAFPAGEGRATASFDLPAELIGEVTRLVLSDDPSPGGSVIADAAIRRVPVAVVDPASEGGVPTLNSARHYLTEALVPWADVAQATLGDVLDRDPEAIFLADQADFTEDERTALVAWVEQGGLLVRFAGPRLAGAIGETTLGAGSLAQADDPLLPVRLRRGGRMLGGALAWGQPRTLGPFDEAGPFRRLSPPDEVEIRTQVLAEPSPDLAGKVWATLDDGTPMVTAETLGEGRVILFHVSADADWSSLPLSGVFVEMLGQIVALAPGQATPRPSEEELRGTLWRLEQTLAPDGTLLPGSASRDPVPGERLVGGVVGGDLWPGIYARADGGPRSAGSAETMVMNVLERGARLDPMPDAPAGAVTERLGGEEPVMLAAPLLLLAVLLAAIDTVATLWLSGRLPQVPGLGRAARTAGAALALAGALAAAVPGGGAAAQDTDGRRSEAEARRDVSAAAETTLGYILTGDTRIDRISERAMVGLGDQLTRRTAVEPGPPVGLDPEVDEMSLIPVIYMPLTATTMPSDLALERLGRYIATGGMLVIDTQTGASNAGGAGASEMRQVARALHLPPLAPVDGDHVLSRTFYLLNSFPGRWRGDRIWAEAPPEGRRTAEADPSLPQFDRVDDAVSPVVVGTADWAAAWAVDEDGRPMFPIGRPGDRQREMAMRFGINLVLYALTGNYKSDQVHAPAVLERLGQ